MRARTSFRRPATLHRPAIAATMLCVLAACQQSADQGAQQQMAWAKVALERNPNVEIVATDMQAGVFTVRDRRTGEVQAVMLGELAAAPIAQLTDPVPAARVQASEEPVAAATPAQDSPPGEEAVQPQPYTIERTDGRVMVTGPGVSIVSGGNPPLVTGRDQPGLRTVDPIVCDGEQMMHIDGREIYVDGDAITVRGGCELYLTNSRIVASGTGVIVRRGVVHVANSHVEGAAAAFDVAGEARLYLRGSVFQGVLRRDTLAMIQDQGGNRGLPTL